MRISIAFILWMLLASQSTIACAAPSTDSPSHKRILLITGEDFKGHLWPQTTPILRNHLAKDSRLKIDVLQDLTLLHSTKLADYHALVLHFKNYDPKTPGRVAFDNLKTYVHNGGGLVLVHFACGAYQEFKDDFVQIAGRVWDPKLRGHDRYGQFKVNITDNKHPITRNMKSFTTTDELYTCLVGETSIRTLATAVSNVDHKTHPMAFVLNVGQGRVFHSTLGHDTAALSVDAVGALYRRATAWAAGLKPVSPKK